MKISKKQKFQKTIKIAFLMIITFAGMSSKSSGKAKNETNIPQQLRIYYIPSQNKPSEIFELKDKENISVMYAYYEFKEDGTVFIEHKKIENQFVEDMKKHPKIKPYISIYGPSSKYIKMASNEGAIDRFVDTLVEKMNEKKIYEGVDIDWEWPREEKEVELFESLLFKLKNKMPEGKKLTIALNPYVEIFGNIDFLKLSKIVDEYNMMTYEFYGSYCKSTGHVSAPKNWEEDELYKQKGSAEGTLECLKSLGVDLSKVFIGFITFGRNFINIEPKNGDPSNTRNFIGVETKRFTAETYPVTIGYTNIINKYFTKDNVRHEEPVDPNVVRYWDDEAKAPLLYNKSTKVLITYEDKESTEEKIKLAKKYKIRGMMLWKLYGKRDAELCELVYNNLVCTPPSK